jgi:hypothetical protein
VSFALLNPVAFALHIIVLESACLMCNFHRFSYRI